MQGTVSKDNARLFDHDVQACLICQPKADYWLDAPCDECGHTWDGEGTTYANGWKTLYVLCERCRIASAVYSGSTVFSFDETGPGIDLSAYRQLSDH